MTDLRPLAVVKVGGSLLDWDELPVRLFEYLASRAGDRLLLVPGGGRLVDVLRDLDRTHGIGEEASHDLALRALDVTAGVLEAIVPSLEVVEDSGEILDAWRCRKVPVLAPRRFLGMDETLEHSWRVTSDSIAAHVAVRMGAAELVLLKSVSAPEGADRSTATRLGLVDPCFVEAASPLDRVVLVDLRGGASAVLARGRRAPG